MKNENYRRRIVDAKLEALLHVFGGVLIVGPKWCGKSWTASNQAGSEVYIDSPENRRRAMLIPDDVLDGPAPRLIDEWQGAPVLWDTARRLIDKEHRPGMYIFTGSAVPDFLGDSKPSHPGTGRFARMRMRPLSLFEKGISNGKVSLSMLPPQLSAQRRAYWRGTLKQQVFYLNLFAFGIFLCIWMLWTAKFITIATKTNLRRMLFYRCRTEVGVQ